MKQEILRPKSLNWFSKVGFEAGPRTRFTIAFPNIGDASTALSRLPLGIDNIFFEDLCSIEITIYHTLDDAEYLHFGDKK